MEHVHLAGDDEDDIYSGFNDYDATLDTDVSAALSVMSAAAILPDHSCFSVRVPCSKQTQMPLFAGAATRRRLSASSEDELWTEATSDSSAGGNDGRRAQKHDAAVVDGEADHRSRGRRGEAHDGCQGSRVQRYVNRNRIYRHSFLLEMYGQLAYTKRMDGSWPPGSKLVICSVMFFC